MRSSFTPAPASRSLAASLLAAPPPASSSAAADVETLELPAAWNPPSRPAVPILASVVPILGAVALWLVTGSVLALWLAALGPLIAGATVLDGARGVRRDRRRADAAARASRERISATLDERHADERLRRWVRHPDVASFLERDGEIWRPVHGREDAVVLGSGAAASATRVVGGGDDAESVRLRLRSARLEDAPVVTAAAAAGIAVVGSPVLAAAVVRALVLQLCMSSPPGALRITGPLRGENAWAQGLPHRRAAGGKALALAGPGESVPQDADIAIARVEPDGDPPPGCAVVIRARSLQHAMVDVAGESQEIAVEAVSAAQAESIAKELAERAARLLGPQEAADPVLLAPLLVDAPRSVRGRLPAVIGVTAGEPCVIDLIADGPHAVVAGVTGSGKSELLITWILALCATHSTGEVSFLLADFKGGTAFDALADTPHVTGVITDLDGMGARRAIESLRAEVRRRESELARVGARDILDPRVDLPRLVIVVDEFAALLGEHPELHAVFTDVAARGRALGMHLILGTQRLAGVVRESLLANCPLRISLRVTDRADSRAIIGTDAAAELPGGAAGRGSALVRIAGDSSAQRVRVALSSPEDQRAIAAAADGPRPRRPWLPALPDRIELADLRSRTLEHGDLLLLGLVDEPELQRQHPVGIGVGQRGLLVVGSAGSGKSTALTTLARQARGEVVRVPANAEGAWDAVGDLSERGASPGSIVLIDDLDALGASLPPDYSRELMDRLAVLVRGAGTAQTLVLASAQRLTGGTGRLAELIPHRLVLGCASRADHIAAGGDPAQYAPGIPPGRGHFDGRSLQVALTPAEPLSAPEPTPCWHPHRALTGFAMRRSPDSRAALTAWERRGVRIISVEEFAGTAEWGGSAPVVVAGDVEEWQRHWRALSMIRADHDFVVDASCAAELRILTGERGLPPYCEPGRARAWLFSDGGPPSRIGLPYDER